MGNSFRLGEKVKDFQQRKVAILDAIANESLNFFKVDVWEAEGFIDQGVKRWPKRKPNTKRNQGRRLLVDTGKLRQSGRVLQRTPGVSARVGFPLPYAGRHNQGDKTLPQRKFIGQSDELDKRSIRIVKNKMIGLL